MAPHDTVSRSVALLDVRGLHRSFYGIRALDGVDLAVEPRTITGLIGPNGAGKTTLFNCVSGLIPPGGGRVVFDGRDITGWRPDRVTQAGLVRTFQIARGFPRLSVLENLMLYGDRQPGEAPVAGGLRAARRPGGARTSCASARWRWPAAEPRARRRRSPPPTCRAARRSCWSSAAR